MHPPSVLHRLVAVGLAAVSAVSAVSATGASQTGDGHRHPVPAAASAPAGESSASGATRTSVAPPPAVDRPDPLEAVRERLARRLGGRPSPGGEPNVVRLVTQPGAASVAGAATPLPSESAAHAAPRRAAPGPRPRIAHAPRVPEAPRPWGYTSDQTGPLAWSRLDPAYAACASGVRQSPIDLRDAVKVELDPVRFDYHPGAFKVLDTGHTVQANLAAGSAIEVGGRRYELLQLHFHRPSEERIDGRQFAMAAHLVHRSADGRLAVVAVLLEPGPAQPLVQAVWNNLPLEQGEEAAARSPLDPADLLPADRRYYAYMGSLTEPPCTEGVLWMVIKQPVGMTTGQDAVFARLYPMNARPLQPAGGRLIKESN